MILVIFDYFDQLHPKASVLHFQLLQVSDLNLFKKWFNRSI